VKEKELRERANLGVCTIEMILSQCKEPLLQWDRLQNELVPIEIPSAEAVPEPEQSSMQGKRITAEAVPFCGSPEILNSEQIPFEVSPAELGNAFVVLDVSAEAIRTEDTEKSWPEQLSQHFRTAAFGHDEEGEGSRHENPEPAFFIVTALTGFIPIEYGFLGELLLELLMAWLQSGVGLFDRFLGASEADRYSGYALQQFFRFPARHSANHR